MKRMPSSVAVVLAALALSLLALPPTAAFADSPKHPDRLRNTTCSYDQVTDAIEKNNPRAAKRLENHKRVAGRLRHVLELSPDERQEKIDAFKAKHPHRARAHRVLLRHHPRVRHVVHRSLKTCADY